MSMSSHTSIITMDDVYTLVKEPGFQLYMFILSIAIWKCFTLFYHRMMRLINTDDDNKSSSIMKKQQRRPVWTLLLIIIPPMLSLLLIGSTWYYIFKFILQNITTSQSYFDDAYKDVLRNHYFSSTQLLTWAIVSVVWVTSNNSNIISNTCIERRRRHRPSSANEDKKTHNNDNSNIPFLLYGFLGCMGASFVLWVPSRNQQQQQQQQQQRHRRQQQYNNNRIPIIFVVTSIMAFICILNIRPCSSMSEQQQQLHDEEENCSRDEGYGSFSKFFHWWLHGLHYVLLLPIVICWVFPKQQQQRHQIDSTLFYATVGITFSIWNLLQLFRGDNYTALQTDCQKSIHIDLFSCSILTLYAIYYDALSSEKGCSSSSSSSDDDDHNNNNINGNFKATTAAGTGTYHESSRAIRIVSIYAFLMPLLSPAAILSFHLCFENFEASYSNFVGTMQRYIASRRSDNDDGWCNLGLWTTKKSDDDNNHCNSFQEACKRLAIELADELKLQSGDGVLCCGCGTNGTELTFYKSRYDLGHITGIDPSINHNSNVEILKDRNIRTIKADIEDWISGDLNERLVRPQSFNKILALDNIYHYANKRSFFRHCMESLPPGGKVAVTDIIWKSSNDDNTMNGGGSNKSNSNSGLLKMTLSAMGVTPSNVWMESAYKSHLKTIGFTDITIKRIGDHVFSGWEGIFPTSLIRHLDYVIVVATKPTTTKVDENHNKCPAPRQKKKRVAVIGSGMAGLAAAHTIHSFVAEPHCEVEVKVYEAASQPGLAGNTMLIGDQFVDVPARMGAVGYYHEYIQLLDKLGISYQAVSTDCTFHGRDGTGGYVKHIYNRSVLANLYNSIMIGGLGNFVKIVRAFSSISHLLADNNSSSCIDGLSFGDWLHRHFTIYPPSSPSSTTKGHGESSSPSKLHHHQGWKFSYFAKHENPFLYMTIGSFGWMLSCTYKQLVACPASILLPYIEGLGLTKNLGLFKKAQVVRIKPSIKALENALLYGIPFQGNTKVTNLGNSKVIDGIEYDAIICATEASAVPYVVRDSAKVFGEFHYHPSTIYLHKDPSLLPENRSDWRTWDVRMDPDHEEPQLTFWLNRYYDEIKFDGDEDVFQTWAPHKTPKDEHVIRKYELSRVVQTSSSAELVKKIEKEQGKDGIYYAGAYAVYGMGLLEQATESGRIAGERVLADLFNDDAK